MTTTAERRLWWIAVAVFCAIGLALRVRGLANPILDHPGWRQGDTAAIARNFALLNGNIFFPQTEYNGAPPHYVELELQIVPYLASLLYRLFGVHEVFGRLIGIAFGVATIAVVGAFARWLFASTAAGLAALAIYAVLPGPVYYSRTFQPDGAMVFFLVAALFAFARWIVEEDGRTWRGALWSALLLALAFLAKPVALLALLPAAALVIARFGLRGSIARPLPAAVLAGALVPLALYQPYVAAHAEWHWASGIMRLHVLPSLVRGLTTAAGFVRKAKDSVLALQMLATTMLGPGGCVLLVAGFAGRLRSRADALLYGWLAAGLIYLYVVVTVERVDYYLYPLVPLGAILGARIVAVLIERLPALPGGRLALMALLPLGWLGLAALDWHEIHPYYAYSRANLADARALDAVLPPDALIVMAHYDPSIMYYIRRKGWMEDPVLWTPRDERSAIRKGSRYFIAIENRRFHTNRALCAWMQRYPVLDPAARWPVYVTDPALVAPDAEADWQSFSAAERSGDGRAWLDARGRCSISPPGG